MGFRMTVDDVFYIGDRGVVVTGKVDHGAVSAGSRIVVERDGRKVHTVTVNAVEFGSSKRARETSDDVGLLLRELGKEDVATGDVLRDGS
jgi:elongation factor Tu